MQIVTHLDDCKSVVQGNQNFDIDYTTDPEGLRHVHHLLHCGHLREVLHHFKRDCCAIASSRMPVSKDIPRVGVLENLRGNYRLA